MMGSLRSRKIIPRYGRVYPPIPKTAHVVSVSLDKSSGKENDLKGMIISIQGKDVLELKEADFRNLTKMRYFGIVRLDKNRRIIPTELGLEVLQGRA